MTAVRQSKETNLKRWFALIDALGSGRRWTVPELATKFGVSNRTIFRDLNNLQDLGFAVERGEGPVWIGPNHHLRPVGFTSEEALAVAVALDFARRNRALSGRVAAQSALEKLRTTMPPAQRAEVAGLEDALIVEPLPAHAVPSHPGVEDCLRAAVQGHRPIQLSYQALKADRPSERVVDPYGLAYRGPGLYLIGFCHLRQGIRTFRANRILSATVLPTVFTRPEDFDLEHYLAGIWGIEDGPELDIRVRFSPPVATLARETVWHPSQQLTDAPDGSVTLALRTRGLNEVARWLTGYGDTVEVLAPTELRQAVATLGRQIAALYAGADGDAVDAG